jgi:hypothetical protein
MSAYNISGSNEQAVHSPLVSCAGSSLKISGEGVEDLVGGLLPHERLGVVVPGLDPGSDVGFEGLDARVGAAADLLVGEVAEPSFDLVEPG